MHGIHHLSLGTRLLICGMAISCLMLLVRPYLPVRHFDLLQSSIGAKPMLMSEEANSPAGGTFMEWVDRSHYHFHCETNSEKGLPLCGIFFDLNRRSDGLGVDLGSFREMVIALRFRGANTHLRVSLGTFTPGLSDPKNHRTWRPLASYVDRTQLAKPAILNLSAWAVPDWWLMSPEAAAFASEGIDLSNCVTLTIDVPYHFGKNSVDIELQQLELRGEWISAHSLYVVLLSVWFTLACFYVAYRLVVARRLRRDHLRMIVALSERERRLRTEQLKLQRMASVDTLTGLLNRFGMELAIKDLNIRETDSLSVFMLDVDHFKSVNDQFGHEAGDLVLRHVAAVLTQCLRSKDLACRWGGEEFVVCTDCGLVDALSIAEKIRQRIAEPNLATGQVRSVTVSIGVAGMYGANGFEDALSRADIAMYQAKRQGRNRVVVDDSER